MGEAVPILGTHPEKTVIQNEMCTPIFTAALFTIAKTQKQPQYLYPGLHRVGASIFPEPGALEVSASLGPMPLHLTLKMCPVIPQGPENSPPRKLLSPLPLQRRPSAVAPFTFCLLQEAVLGPIHSPSSHCSSCQLPG